MRKFTAYQSSDGEIFESEEACAQHEQEMAKGKVIRGFLDSEYNPYQRGAFRNAAVNIILAWERWKKDTNH